MQDYTKKFDEKKTYIKKIEKAKRNGEEFYKVKFADGTTFYKVSTDKESLKQLMDVQEQQASLGIEREKEIEKKNNGYILKTIACAAITGFIGGTTAAGIYPFHMNGPEVGIGLGTIALGAAAYSFFKFVETRKQLKEIKKIAYRNQNEKDLKEFKNYENALTGLSRGKKKYFEETEYPYSIVNTNYFTKKDLQQIMDNIDREKTYKFKYVNTEKSNKQ
ncbi:MAG: hypothetical protein IJ193_06835 [Bacilli bacterium]|nr:hypothetical protein [Bacilli bacterium]